MDLKTLREKIDAQIGSEAWPGAAAGLAELFAQDHSSSAAAYVVSRFEKLRGHVPLTPYRLAILRSFTVEPMVPVLRAMAFTAGIDLSVHLGEFNAYAQEILDPQNRLYEFQPDAAILAVETRGAAPGLWQDYASTEPSARGVLVEDAIARLTDAMRAFRERSQAHLIVHTLECPARPAMGLLDSQSECGQAAAIQQVNQALRAAARDLRGVYLLDYDSLVARHGRNTWHDERKWLMVRLPMTAAHITTMAREWMRFLHPLTGKIAKAVAVDLDNTLWGGVIGEDGMAGIRLGSEYPGAAFQEVQRALLDLYHRGILLAICSKNNPADALEALEQHPGMLLRPSHFAAMRINWAEKGPNLREIAQELNIGIDTLAFVDDNPVECQHVHDSVPEAMVVRLPAEPMAYSQTLRDCPYFERLALSEEDRQRGQYYAAERERAALEKSVSSPEDFYRSLEQEAEIAPVSEMTLGRVAQLTQKTNQFNLTTRRYTEQQIAEMAARPGWRVLWMRVRDRYADNGLVGIAITHDEGEACEIDSFLLSCRVIGRTVETAFLSYLASAARARGARRLRGWFLPTKKNAPAKDFYARHGFAVTAENGDGALWELDLTQTVPAWPAWIAGASQEQQTA